MSFVLDLNTLKPKQSTTRGRPRKPTESLDSKPEAPEAPIKNSKIETSAIEQKEPVAGEATKTQEEAPDTEQHDTREEAPAVKQEEPDFKEMTKKELEQMKKQMAEFMTTYNIKTLEMTKKEAELKAKEDAHNEFKKAIREKKRYYTMAGIRFANNILEEDEPAPRQPVIKKSSKTIKGISKTAFLRFS